jgi:hypothetical protein
LSGLAPAWEKAMTARRDAALRALADENWAVEYRARIDRAAESRRAMLLELEMMLSLESPAELKAQRLALQVKLLRDRFQSAAPTGTTHAGDRLLAWCAEPGVADATDRVRSERVFAAIARAT